MAGGAPYQHARTRQETCIGGAGLRCRQPAEDAEDAHVALQGQKLDPAGQRIMAQAPRGGIVSDQRIAPIRRHDPARIVSLGARVDGEVVGTGSLVIAPQPRRGHCGALGMGIDPAFQGRSVGRQLLDALLAAADARGLSRVALEVWEDNERARRLYASRGFEVECVERAIGYREGAFVTDLSMARLRGAALDR